MTLKFRSRLLGTLIVSNLCVLVLGFSSFYILGGINERLTTFTEGILHRLEISNDLKRAADGRAIAVRNALILDNPNSLNETYREFENYQGQTGKLIDELDQAATLAKLPENVIESIRKIKQVESKYNPVAREIIDDLKNHRKDAALIKVREVCSPTLIELTKAIDDYETITDKRIKLFIAETKSATSAQRVILSLTALISLLISVTLGLLLKMNINKTLGDEPEEINNLLGQIAHGDLESINQLHVSKQGSILDAIFHMQNQMRTVVAQVREGANGVANSSQQIADGNQNLSSRTESQASSLEETAASMEELNSQVGHNAENARNANELATQASEVARRGGEIVEHVVSTMNEINDSSRKIADIIGVIDGIAFQTNILALNAAVEAARAGEQGRGFAVVAAEVRTLAGRSASAAKEIKILIDANMDRVIEGSDLVHKAGLTMNEVVESIKSVNVLVSEISEASKEQAAGVSQVGQAVTEMDQTTQQNAALVEQMATATGNLSHQARELVKTVEIFKLGKNLNLLPERIDKNSPPISRNLLLI